MYVFPRLKAECQFLVFGLGFFPLNRNTCRERMGLLLPLKSLKISAYLTAIIKFHYHFLNSTLPVIGLNFTAVSISHPLSKQIQRVLAVCKDKQIQLNAYGLIN